MADATDYRAADTEEYFREHPDEDAQLAEEAEPIEPVPVNDPATAPAVPTAEEVDDADKEQLEEWARGIKDDDGATLYDGIKGTGAEGAVLKADLVKALNKHRESQ